MGKNFKQFSKKLSKYKYSRNHAHKSPWKSSGYLKKKKLLHLAKYGNLYSDFNYLINNSIYNVPEFSTFFKVTILIVAITQ